MTIDRIIRQILMVGALVLLAWLPAVLSHAADQASGGTMAAASTTGLAVVASGAVEDTLKACLARIPSDATLGQRMFAEQSCERDETTRKSIQAVPGR